MAIGKEQTFVRLVGVDASETGHSKALKRQAVRRGRSVRAEAAAGAKARDFARALLPAGALIDLQPDALSPKRDRYGRLLAYVTLPDGRPLNELLIERGMARASTRFAYERKPRFIELERRAREAGRGLWSQGGP